MSDNNWTLNVQFVKHVDTWVPKLDTLMSDADIEVSTPDTYIESDNRCVLTV